jgi:hypothetical protein
MPCVNSAPAQKSVIFSSTSSRFSTGQKPKTKCTRCTLYPFVF